jgi:hypothetical protein
MISGRILQINISTGGVPKTPSLVLRSARLAS